jgi:hypothetical protein
MEPGGPVRQPYADEFGYRAYNDYPNRTRAYSEELLTRLGLAGIYTFWDWVLQ